MVHEMSWFDDDEFWTGFAEVIFSPQREQAAARVVAESPLFAFPSGARVLDQGCGPGFYAGPLSARGFGVTGIDLSPPMLERARSACADAGVKVELMHADMRDYVAAQEYDVVLNLCTSLGYFEDDAQNLQVLRNAHTCLAPGGQFLVDTMGKEIYAAWTGPSGADRPRVVEVDGGHVFMHGDVMDSWSRYRTDYTMVRGGTAKHACTTSFLYSAVELRQMFEKAGFVDIECFGGFHGGPYGPGASRLIVRGVRPSD
jgi:SAM-dependent methyltransferase